MKKLVFSLVALTLVVTAVALCACTDDAIPLPEEETLQKVLDEGGYELVWGDEFDDDSIDHTKWRVGYDTPARRAGWYVDTSDTVFEKDGALTIRTQYRENGKYGAGWYTSWVDSATGYTRETSQMVHSDDYQGFAAKYGYFEIRCIAPPCTGIWSAFWMMPDGDAVGMSENDIKGTGTDGLEVDVMESPYHAWGNSYNVHVVHGEGYSDTRSDRSATYEVPNMYSQYHTYGVLWTEEEYVFYIDGRETWRTEDENGVLHPGVTLEDGVEVPFWCGDPDDNDKTKTYDFVIDYVRVYQKAA